MLMKKIQSTDLSLEKLSSTANINIYFQTDKKDRIGQKKIFVGQGMQELQKWKYKRRPKAVFYCPALEGKRTIVLTKFRSVTEPIIPATF